MTGYDLEIVRCCGERVDVTRRKRGKRGPYKKAA
jgi:hypothetical protein